MDADLFNSSAYEYAVPFDMIAVRNPLVVAFSNKGNKGVDHGLFQRYVCPQRSSDYY